MLSSVDASSQLDPMYNHHNSFLETFDDEFTRFFSHEVKNNTGIIVQTKDPTKAMFAKNFMF